MSVSRVTPRGTLSPRSDSPEIEAYSDRYKRQQPESSGSSVLDARALRLNQGLAPPALWKEYFDGVKADALAGASTAERARKRRRMLDDDDEGKEDEEEGEEDDVDDDFDFSEGEEDHQDYDHNYFDNGEGDDDDSGGEGGEGE